MDSIRYLTMIFFRLKQQSPVLKNSKKIDDFLSAYDEAITYTKQELDKWKELKKDFYSRCLFEERLHKCSIR